MGVAVAGLAVALQEVITSFFSWSLIRGSQGYRVRDWIQIGDQYGEVVDISLMLTTLGQVTPIGPRGEAGGGWTGGLTILPNSAIRILPSGYAIRHPWFAPAQEPVASN